MAFKDYSSLSAAFATILFFGFLRALAGFYKARSRVAALRKQGLPMPPWNPLLGHLYFCYKITSKLPKDAHPNYLPDMIRRDMPDLGPLYYIDTWPFGPQMLVVASTKGLYQITQEHSLPKYPALKDFLRPIAGGVDLVTMEGDAWRTWRGIFNPGFNLNYLITLTSGIILETHQFCNVLDGLSQNQKTFRMKDLTDNLTMDIIGTIVMNDRLHSQSCSNPLVNGLRMQVKWLTFGAGYNPVRPFVHWYNSRCVNKHVLAKIDGRFRELQHEGRESDKKSILDLVLTTYLSENRGRKSQDLNRTFRNFTMNQIKLFLFSGHDTTSSTVCYIFYVLATKPAIMARVRTEHDSVIGSDTTKAASTIKSDPFLLNKLPYTTAVIKEVMRLFPAVSGTRAGEPGFNVTDDMGRQFPTDSFLVWDIPQAIHRDPNYWPRPDEFIPERWLATQDSPLHPIKGAWRPFSHGPRNCIGQELAMMEMKVIMIMASRAFDISLAYEDLDHAGTTARISTVYGERAYQIQRAQPSGDLPCRVSQRKFR